MVHEARHGHGNEAHRDDAGLDYFCLGQIIASLEFLRGVEE